MSNQVTKYLLGFIKDLYKYFLFYKDENIVRIIF